MLFLAVFCGFLAENQREHYIEHKREKQFMKSLVNDIEGDTAQFSSILRFRLRKMDMIDSVLRFFAKNPSSTIPLHVYTLMGQLRGHRAFYQNSGTLDQLKNAGGLRLISHRVIVDSIQSYDQQIKRMELRDMYETEEIRYTIRFENSLFDAKVLTKFYTDTSFFNKPPPSSTETLIMHAPYIDQYLNSLLTYRQIIKINFDLQTNIKRKAAVLTELIKKEYHLE